MNDGGPAFPKNGFRVTPDGKTYRETIEYQRGMSLRDWFAGMALIGVLASRDERGRGGFSELSEEKTAVFALKQADAMLAAREK